MSFSLSRRQLSLLCGLGMVGAGPFISSSSALAAGAADLGVSPAQRVDGKVVPELSSSQSTTWMTKQGYVTKLYPRPVNVKDASGKWRAIDNKLYRQADGTLDNGAGTFDLTLPAKASGPVVLSHDGNRLSVALQGAASAAAVDGSTATYAGVASGVTAKLSANNEAVKEDLLLADASATRSFTYDLSLSDGLAPKLRKDGGIDIVDGKGDAAFTAPAPVAADRFGDVAPAKAISTKLARTAQGWELTVALDQGWLSSAGRAFPVTLDPSFSLGASRDCFVDQLDSTLNFCSSGELWAGRASAGHNHNALLAFNLGTLIPAGAQVQQAELKLWPLYQTTAGAAKTLYAKEPTSDWDNNATWIKRTASANWGTAGGDLATTSLSSQPLPASGNPARFTITDAVSSWVAGKSINRGIAITDNGSTVDNAQVFASADWSDSSKWPSLTIEYQYRIGSLSSYTIDRQALSDRSSIGVNVAGGNLLLESSDLQVASTGLSLGIQRTYNSFEPWDGQLGTGGVRISMGEDVKLYDCDADGSKCLIGPTGFRARFKKSGSTFVTPPGIGNVTLKQQTTGALKFELTDNGSGTVYEFFNAPFSFMDAVRDRNGNEIDLDFTGINGNISNIRDTNGRNFPVHLNAAGYVDEIQVPASISGGNFKWQYGYNAYNFLTSVTDPNGKITTYGYAANDKINRITDPRGNDTLIIYDSFNRVSSITRKVDGTVANDVTTSYAYSSPDGTWCKQASPTQPNEGVGVTTITDPRGKTIKYCWGSEGTVIRTRDALNRDRSTSYTPAGNAENLGSIAAGTSSAYSTTAYAYSGGGQTPTATLDSITAPSGEKTSFTYNTGGSDVFNTQTKQSKDTEGDLAKFTYDASANLTKVESQRGSGATTLTTDLVWDPTNKSRLKSSTDKAGHTTTYNYDPVKKDLIEVVPHDSSIIGSTQLQTDGLSRVTQMKDGRAGQWVQYTYDNVGRQLTTPDSDGLTGIISYDGNGNVLTRSLPAASPAQYSTYTYDKLNRKTSETLDGATTTYTYDKAGNLTSLTDASGTTSYEYDDIGRVAKIISPTATTGTDNTVFGYTDPTSPTDTSAATMTLPGNGTVKRSTDTSGKLKQVIVKDPSGNQTLRQTFTYTGDNDDNPATPNGEQTLLGASSLQIGGTTATAAGKAYEYTSAGQIAKVITSSGGATTNTTTYAYDGAGNRTSRVKTPASGPVDTTTYAYNSVNELCWQYAGASAAGCSAPPTGSTSYAYDKAGNQLTGGYTGTWDAKGRIDAFNGAYSKILSPTNNEVVGFGSAQTFTNTALGVQRINVGGNLTKIVRHPGGAAINQVRDGVKGWFVTDQIGSTIALVDGAGTIKRTYTYDIDGNSTTTAYGTGTNPETWIKYTGGHDVGGGLYHFGARYYQPSTARWTQMDPLVQPGDLGQANRYIYVGGNPVNSTDPSGLLTFEAGIDVGPLSFSASVDDKGGSAISIGAGKSWGGSAKITATEGRVDETGSSVEAGGCVGSGGLVCGSVDNSGKTRYGIGFGSPGGGIQAKKTKRLSSGPRG